ncbi:MAG: response regulator [Chloroflexi bacterium]|nr:MAG: response regulator [Chloroflexota bacterium]
MGVESQTVLCIEETPNVTRVVNWFLQAHGYDVLWAATGEEGLKMAESFLPDVTLVDGSLPDMSCEQVLMALRSHQNQKVSESRIIGVMDKKTRDRTGPLVTAHFDQIVPKPVIYNQLRSRIFSVLSA